ncbi:terminase small subunit [Diaphorobacter sp. HDW4A]|uniref:terminase small subunit n=1 Tax=Diaphorobacter sp. HDW4A TaxID=2714924 RepID=UPI00140B8479|nr:terminase small subunit [Diaphorobacter sp. HDW4A]QIL80768.1 terminase small subunit [Diaphorobacter sp. HDW4A]
MSNSPRKPKPPTPKKGKARTRDKASPAKPKITTDDRYRAFAREYVVSDFNATQAAVKAGYSKNTAASQGARLLRNVKVQEFVREFSKAVVERAEVKAEDVVRRLNQMLMADPRELVEVFVACCRHCYGIGYQYTMAEYNSKREKWMEEGKPIEAFPELGGLGYDARKPPNQDCPECFGGGMSRTVLKDTRNMSPGALALFAGAKETRNGLEVSIHTCAADAGRCRHRAPRRRHGAGPRVAPALQSAGRSREQDAGRQERRRWRQQRGPSRQLERGTIPRS